ncbi:hypothetical protein PMES_03071 [Profundibacterium mesophilum KAUST100406-0324]|uniref:Uncharacterized protein n=1 Tax=Profundibacterium mesophilum KAUST100406-0324 TaxID=1037889 RepID=A0A921NR76_9RHOB|nr:hypothetical protein PMES_03071 [Profundibacterium mesophilum KAUST100406-0324]
MDLVFLLRAFSGVNTAFSLLSSHSGGTTRIPSRTLGLARLALRKPRAPGFPEGHAELEPVVVAIRRLLLLRGEEAEFAQLGDIAGNRCARSTETRADLLQGWPAVTVAIGHPAKFSEGPEGAGAHCDIEKINREGDKALAGIRVGNRHASSVRREPLLAIVMAACYPDNVGRDRCRDFVYPESHTVAAVWLFSFSGGARHECSEHASNRYRQDRSRGHADWTLSEIDCVFGPDHQLTDPLLMDRLARRCLSITSAYAPDVKTTGPHSAQRPLDHRWMQGAFSG